MPSSRTQSIQPIQPFVAPKLFPSYLKESNITRFGFNNEHEILLGFPLNLYPIRDHHNDLLDPRRNSSWLRHDLVLPSYYDTEQYFSIEGEWLPFPITRVVYRRDRDLLKSEILDYLLSGSIPARYPKRESGGVINEPMNEENWKHMVRRFYLDYEIPGGVPFLRERSTGFRVQEHYMHFEDNLWMRGVVDALRPETVAIGPKHLVAEVNKRVDQFWYPDVRLRAAIARLRILIGPEFRYKFKFPGVSDIGEEIHGSFEFDDGEKCVEIDC
ncbi:hypothetical protein C8R43DRAFT_1138573 [Mycena crocata]|nr:hypothetical protein C8R43DRAFT_1138573 [Mycena crocata]